MRLLIREICCYVLVFVAVKCRVEAINCQPTESKDGPKLIRMSLERVSGQVEPSSKIDSRFDHTFKVARDSDWSQHLNDSSQLDLIRIEMLNIVEMNYIININLGEPSQTFRALVDTGSDFLWVPSVSCKTHQCLMRNRYDSSKSISYKSLENHLFRIGYSGGQNVTGHFSSDRLEFSGISLRGQSFLEVEEMSGSFMKVPFMDGILGMNFESSLQNYTSPMRNLIERKLVSETMVSFSSDFRINSRNAGEMIIGGLARDRYVGGITWAPKLHKYDWHIRLDSIRLEHTRASSNNSKSLTKVCRAGCNSAIDTGTNIIVGVAEHVAKLNERMGARQDDSGFWILETCDLSRLPNLVFSISGTDFTLTPADYVLRSAHGCVSGLRARNTDHWTIGDLFIRKYYTVFDYGEERVGFAESAIKEV